MRPTYSFPEAVVDATARDRYGDPDPRVRERMEILGLKSKDEPHGRIAERANVSRSTVPRTLRICVAKGFDGIRSFAWEGQPGALAPHAATIEQAFREHPPHTAPRRPGGSRNSRALDGRRRGCARSSRMIWG